MGELMAAVAVQARRCARGGAGRLDEPQVVRAREARVPHVTRRADHGGRTGAQRDLRADRRQDKRVPRSAGEHAIDPQTLERPGVRLELLGVQLGQGGTDPLRIAAEREERQGERVQLPVDGVVVAGPEGPADGQERRGRRRAAAACEGRELQRAPGARRLVMVVSAHFSSPELGCPNTPGRTVARRAN